MLQSIRQHARSSMKAEICGVLIGYVTANQLVIDGSIPGENAAQGEAHVTFTQATWEHIFRIKDRDFPDERIMGWYHSHPGFGVFLSDYDQFIHENFFSAPRQIAWVYDPHSDEEGCFAWQSSKLRRLNNYCVVHPGADVPEEPRAEPITPAVKPQKNISWWAGLASWWLRRQGESLPISRSLTSKTSGPKNPGPGIATEKNTAPTQSRKL